MSAASPALEAPVRLAPGSRHAIPVRRPEFDFSGPLPRHGMAGNAVASHVFNGLNLVFPDGERFFALRGAGAERIGDPVAIVLRDGWIQELEALPDP